MFIVVMILSLAAVGLAPGLGSSGGVNRSGVPIDDEEGTPPPEAAAVPTVAPLEGEIIDASQPHTATIITDQGPIELELATDAPRAVNNFVYLVRQNFYDDLEFFWVKPGFTAQTGDPTCTAAEDLTCSGAGGPGYTLPREGTAAAGQWSVIAPVTLPGSDEVHGSQLVIALTDQQFEGTVIGRVVAGQDVLEALAERVPCFGSTPSEANPCQTDSQLPPPLVIEDVEVDGA